MVTVYTTAPTAVDSGADEYRKHLLDVARWTEESGCRGLLVYSDNGLADPWGVTQMIVANTEVIAPLVAVQPVYMSPFTAARAISTVGLLYGRALDINLVTGGFGGHLRALDDSLDHDTRYLRLIEYGRVVQALLTAERPVSFAGEYYRLHAAGIAPRLEPELLPKFFLSGSSPAGQQAQRELAVPRFAYPRLIDDYEDPSPLQDTGIRIGIIAREDGAAAWAEAERRFPIDLHGEKLHDLAARVVESSWHRSLSADAGLTEKLPRGAYWLYPFRTYKTFCPYFVGTYDEVARLLARYFVAGVHTVILDEPETADDVRHSLVAIRAAERSLTPAAA